MLAANVFCTRMLPSDIIAVFIFSSKRCRSRLNTVNNISQEVITWSRGNYIEQINEICFLEVSRHDAAN